MTGTTSVGEASTTATGGAATTGTATTAGSQADSGSSSAGSSSTGDACVPGTEGCACDGGACEGALACVEELCVVPYACDAQLDSEPNDDEASAVELGDDPTCNATFGLVGSVDAGDRDWFRVVADDIECTGNPYIRALASESEPIEICIYYECTAGVASFPCVNGTQAISPEGRVGCCGVDDVRTGNITCMGAGPSGNAGSIYYEIAPTSACVDYNIGGQYF